MNDPNGLIHANGLWHLFYQHNPHGTDWGHMSWGHATSTDLVEWEHQPIALPERPDRGYTIFSGSVVADRFGQLAEPVDGLTPLLAFFTADRREDRRQDIHAAVSTDNGMSFSELDANPLLSPGEAKFGDPRVFRLPQARDCLMVVIQGAPQGRIAFYRSADLLHWEHTGTFADEANAEGVWECPDLYPLPLPGGEGRRWVLRVNTVEGHRSLYWLGSFDGNAFTAETGPLVHNLGDAYAEQTYNDAPDGHVIELAWVRQWPLGHRDFTGLQTIPRVQELRATAEGPRLFQRPHPAIDGRITVEASHRITEWAVHQHPIVLPETGRGRILWPVEAGQTSRLSLTGPAPEPLTLAYDGAAGTLTLERPPCEPITAALAPGLEQLDLDLWTDREVLEAFIDDGRWTLTAVLAPKGSA